MVFFNYLYNNYDYKYYPTDKDKRNLIYSKGLRLPYNYKDIDKVISESRSDEEKKILQHFRKTGWPMLKLEKGRVYHYNLEKEKFRRVKYDVKLRKYNGGKIYDMLRRSKSIANTMIIFSWIDMSVNK